MFANRDRDRKLDDDDKLIRVFGGLPNGFTLTNRAGTRHANELITYLPDGSSRRNRTLMVCTARAVRETWSIVQNIVGRPRMAKNWGTCPGVG